MFHIHFSIINHIPNYLINVNAVTTINLTEHFKASQFIISIKKSICLSLKVINLYCPRANY